MARDPETGEVYSDESEAHIAEGLATIEHLTAQHGTFSGYYQTSNFPGQYIDPEMIRKMAIRDHKDKHEHPTRWNTEHPEAAHTHYEGVKVTR